MFGSLLAGAGFSLSSGINAYLPLLILALADRVGNAIELERPYSWVSSPAGLIVLLLVLPIELVGDKIPRFDRLNDIVHAFLRPLAAAFCFMAIASQDDQISVWLAGILGAALGLAATLWKMRERRAVSRATAGLGTPIVSLFEDGLVVVVAVCSAFVPLANLIIVPLGALALARSYRRMATGRSRTIRVFQPRPRA